MSISTITAKDLDAWLKDGDEIALFDVREDGAFGLGHPFLAVPLPYSRLETRLAALVPRRSARIVLVDDDDGVAVKAARKMAGFGYDAVHVLDGGVAAWEKAGHILFKGVNVPSKAFGEFVEHHYHTPSISAEELEAMRREGRKVVVVDSRPFEEYHRQSIPGAVSCPGAELAWRIRELAPEPDTTVVVNCAGRTRSIMGAQSLINSGIPNKVVALRNGTMGWRLAGFTLDHGAERRAPDPREETRRQARETVARAVIENHGVPVIDAETLKSWRQEQDRRTLYLADVRDPDEYAHDHIEGAVSAPGGQLVQATDQWLGARGARVVLTDEDGVRAPMTAHWLRQMGWDAVVLDHTQTGKLPRAKGPWNPPVLGLDAGPVDEIDAKTLAGLLDKRQAAVLDVGYSMAFRKAHVPGALWAARPRIEAAVAKIPPDAVLVLTSEDGVLARLAALDLARDTDRRAKVLAGGLEAWRKAGLAVEESPDTPPDEECIDYLFWVHDRHDGVVSSMHDYLNWELGLNAQVEAEGNPIYRLTGV